MSLITTIVTFILLFCLVSCSMIQQRNNLEFDAQTEQETAELAKVTAAKESEQGEKEEEWVPQPQVVKESREFLGLFGTDKRDRSPSQIHGTAKISADQKADGDVYFLYGAEHLNLTNYYFDIPVVYNAAVKRWMNYFLDEKKGRGRDYFIRYTERSGRYAPILGKILEDQGMPRDLIFLAMAESGFNTKAKSWAKAVGPWQFMPFTGRKFGLKINWHVDERRDPIKATVAAAKYLKVLYKKFGSWELAAAGYNAGEGKVGRAVRRAKTKNFWKIRKWRRLLRRETKEYVPKIMALAIIGKNLDSFGFKSIDFHEPLDYDEIIVPSHTDLFKVAELSGVPSEELIRLNPEIMRWYTPKGQNYTLRLPVGYKELWKTCCATADIVAVDFQEYKMKGERSTLSSVARKFKVPKNILAKLNGMSHKKRLKRGTTVLLPFRKGQSKRANMYSDLYENPRRHPSKWRKYKTRLKRGLKRGKQIGSPKEYYTVRKGDSLWLVAKKTGVSLDTIIRSNYRIVKRRMIRAGDELVIR